MELSNADFKIIIFNILKEIRDKTEKSADNLQLQKG